jgi:hypothetical protein
MTFLKDFNYLNLKTIRKKGKNRKCSGGGCPWVMEDIILFLISHISDIQNCNEFFESNASFVLHISF